jgi:hypothetical protein
MSYSEESEFEETISEGIVEPEQDEEFEVAVFELSELTGNNLLEEKNTKKRSLETNEVEDSQDRKIVHRMYGCRHCKSKLGHVEDMHSIHKRIDEIFKLMKETVQR